jgi:hypothetical protein
MDKSENKIMLPEETIISKIYLIRRRKVILDRDLAEFWHILFLRCYAKYFDNLKKKKSVFRIPLFEAKNFLI